MTQTSFLELSNLSASSDADQRAEAARELHVHFPRKEAVECLRQLLGDPDWRVRRAAVDSFLCAPSGSWISGLFECLYDEENAGKRNAAITVLSRLGPQILPYLEPHLQSSPPDVRMFLVQILGELQDRTYLENIREAADHNDENLVSAALVALGKIGDVRAIPSLLQAMQSADEWLRFQAIEAAGELQDPSVLPVLLQLAETPTFRGAVLGVLSKVHHADSIRALVLEICSNSEWRAKAILSLTDLYDSVQPSVLRESEQAAIRQLWRRTAEEAQVQRLIGEFRAASADLQSRMIKILGWSESQNAAAFLVGLLYDPDFQDSAQHALLQSGASAVAPLFARLASEKDEDALLRSLDLLIELTGQQISAAWTSVIEVGILKQLVGHSNVEIRHRAHVLLFQLRPVLDVLLVGAFDPYPPVQQFCISALLRDHSNNENVLRTAAEKRNSEDAWERAAAVELLSNLNLADADVALACRDAESVVREKAVEMMGKFAQPDFERHLISALADEDAKVRELAARGLSSYRSHEVHEALHSRLHDDQLWVRIATYQSLCLLDEQAAHAVLEERLQVEIPPAQVALLECFRNSPSINKFILLYTKSPSPEVRKAACVVADSSKDRAVISRLLVLMESDPSWMVRAAAVQTLTKSGVPDISRTLLARLGLEKEPMVQRAILNALRGLTLHSFPEEAFPFLVQPETMDAAYELLQSLKRRFGAALRESADRQSPAIRRILLTIQA